MIEVGQSVGNYVVTAKLGEGGMGTVFLAEHPVIGSKVALKAIHPQFARDADVFSRFVNEAKSVNQIGHDHIVDITDFGNTPSGDFYFAMEYLEGSSMAAAITRDGPFSPARALNIAAQIADALSSSHEHGVVHRDLKPENIFLIMRDEALDFVKVLDFGLAKLMRPDEPLSHHTGAGFVMGTPLYMAPEQCEGRADIDHRTDIYALGVMVFEMLTGMVPFGGREYADILMKQITVPPPAVRSIRPELSPALDLILYRALAKAPGARFQTMAAFRQALQDPEGYVPPGNVAGAFEDLAARVRVAMPMPRADVQLRLAQAAASVGTSTPALSTFRSAAVQLDDDDGDLKPKRHRGRVVLVMGIAAVAGMVLAGKQYRHQATSFVVSAVSERIRAPVLVTFNSDPDGASVATANGTFLGVTPLLTKVPYGEIANEYVIRKVGYLAQVASIIPNGPRPFFAVLEPRPVAAIPPTEPPAEPLAEPLAVVPASPEVRPPTVEKPRPPRARRSKDPDEDQDDVMGPSAP